MCGLRLWCLQSEVGLCQCHCLWEQLRAKPTLIHPRLKTSFVFRHWSYSRTSGEVTFRGGSIRNASTSSGLTMSDFPGYRAENKERKKKRRSTQQFWDVTTCYPGVFSRHRDKVHGGTVAYRANGNPRHGFTDHGHLPVHLITRFLMLSIVGAVFVDWSGIN